VRGWLRTTALDALNHVALIYTNAINVADWDV
jgi:hypothetical protein